MYYLKMTTQYNISEAGVVCEGVQCDINAQCDDKICTCSAGFKGKGVIENGSPGCIGNCISHLLSSTCSYVRKCCSFNFAYQFCLENLYREGEQPMHNIQCV